MNCSCSKPFAHTPRMKPNRLKVAAVITSVTRLCHSVRRKRDISKRKIARTAWRFTIRPPSRFVLQQGDEDILERALAGVQVLEGDAQLGEPAQQQGDARLLVLRVEAVLELGAARLPRQVPGREPRRG